MPGEPTRADLPVFEREQRVTCVVCPGCAFTFDEGHIDADSAEDVTYTCPACGTKGMPEAGEAARAATESRGAGGGYSTRPYAAGGGAP